MRGGNNAECMELKVCIKDVEIKRKTFSKTDPV